MHASLALFLLAGCLVNEATYLARRADLTDADGDGFAREHECDDADPTVFPDAAETCDGIDQDCDGAIDEDATDAPTWHADRDGDGFGSPTDTQAACDATTGVYT
ncbi:MAG: putative metal-binding motif-containing protein, partial [Myxococcota bacterium]